MRHSTFSSAFVAPNCFRTVVGEYGITCYYSVCVGNSLNLPEIESAYCPSYLRDQHIPTADDSSFTCIHRVVDRSITFYKTPYKQCYPKRYTQHFGFIIFKCFTPYREIRRYSSMQSNNYCNVRGFLANLAIFYSK